MNSLLGYSPSLLPLESENALKIRRLLSSPPQRHITLCGCVGSAKTFLLLAWVHKLCLTQPSVRVAICRQERTTLYTTLIESLRKVLHHGTQNAAGLPYEIHGGARKPDSIRYATGSSITFLGYDSSKLFGSEWSLVWTNESRLVDEKNYSDVAARLRGGGFWDRNGNETYLMLADTNADHSQHWIKRWEEDKRLLLVNASIEDNPYYYTNGEYTKEGIMYLDDLKVAYTGWAYRRFVDNEWVDAEGAVYGGVFNEKTMVVDLDIPSNWWYGVSIDHSHSGTIALTLWATDRRNQKTHAVKTIYTTELSIDEIIDEFEILLERLGLTRKQVRIFVADWDPSKNVEIERRGYRVTNATKKVIGGIEVVKNWMIQGKLTFSPNILAHAPSAKLRMKGKCDHPFQEFQRYVYPPNCVDDKPRKGHDDFCDSVRYWIEYVAGKPRIGKIPKIISVVTAPSSSTGLLGSWR